MWTISAFIARYLRYVFILTRRITRLGLGSNADDICGRDWVSGAGDHGDPGNSESLLTEGAFVQYSSMGMVMEI